MLRKGLSERVERSNLSINGLAARYNIPYSNLYRFLKKDRSLTAIETLSILKSMGKNTEEIYTSLESLFPEEYKNGLGHIFEGRKSYQFGSDDLEAHLVDPRYFDILNMAWTTDGVSKEDYIIENGKVGERKINYLIGKNLITEENGYLFGSKENFQTSNEAVKAQIKLSVDYHDSTKTGRNSNFLRFMTATLAKKRKETVFHVLRLSRKVISEVINDGIVSEPTRAEFTKLLNQDKVSASPGEVEEHMFISMVYDNFEKSKDNVKEVMQ